MRHRLKFSQNSYVRMRSWEQRGKTNGKRKRDLGQDAQREGAGGWEGEAWRKTPGGKQRVRGIRGQRDTGEGREEKYQRDREPAEEAGRDPQTPPPTQLSLCTSSIRMLIYIPYHILFIMNQYM